VIEVKGVTKKYGKVVAVDNISFEVNDHEIVGFLGPNGAGKTTTMNMITGYSEPTSGRIMVNGFNISKSPRKAKMQIGYMPENAPVYNDMTVKEFVTYIAELRGIDKKEIELQVNKIIKKTGLKNVEDKLIKNISRGYKQRTSIAAALVGEPEVLVLDEPTVGLDPKQVVEIRNLIKKLGENHTVILSSHILSEVSQICSRVVIINRGKIVAIDTPENLEEQVKNDNSIIVVVEDKKQKMKDIKAKLKGCVSIEKIKDMDDGSAKYKITAEPNADIRKEIFEVFPKEEITIFELKKEEASLEDAFLRIINSHK